MFALCGCRLVRIVDNVVTVCNRQFETDNEMSSRQKQSNLLVKQGRGRRTRKTLGGQKTLLKIHCNL